MNLDKFPTDNLYKFLAISGLAIFLISILYPYFRIHELGIRIIEAELKIRVLGLDVDNLAQDSHPSREAVLQKQIKLEELQNNQNINRFLLNELLLVRHFAQFGILAGFVLSVLGFHLWYTRLQFYQDKMIKAQSEAKSRIHWFITIPIALVLFALILLILYR